MDDDGSDQTPLTNDNPSFDGSPAWSPTGDQIAFQSFRDGNTEIYTMNSEGSTPTRLTNNPASDALPAWSPNGDKIAFVSRRDGNDEVYVMNADGSEQTRLTNKSASDSQPNWSPDGTKIIFASLRDGDDELYVMYPVDDDNDGNGDNLVQLTDNQVGDFQPAWSADGQKITFGSDRHGNFEIYMMNAFPENVTTNEPQRLTNNPALDFKADWQPVTLPR